jgi:hypothetical protein
MKKYKINCDYLAFMEAEKWRGKWGLRKGFSPFFILELKKTCIFVYCTRAGFAQ